MPLYWAHLIAYLFEMFGVGAYHARTIKTMEQFLVANRDVGCWRIVGITAATACGASLNLLGGSGLQNRRFRHIFLTIAVWGTSLGTVATEVP